MKIFQQNCHHKKNSQMTVSSTPQTKSHEFVFFSEVLNWWYCNKFSRW